MTAPQTLRKSVTSSAAPRVTKVTIADDDQNEHLLMMLAAESAGRPMELTFIDGGSDLVVSLGEAETLEELPDIVILDLRMPGMNGHSTLEHLQAHPVLSRIPVLMYTTSTRKQDEILAYRAGATWFETKAVDFEELTELMTRITDLSADDWRNDFREDANEQQVTLEQLSVLRNDLLAEVEDHLLGGSS